MSEINKPAFWIRALIALAFLTAPLSQPASADQPLRLIAKDGQFLGEISCVGPKAIGNAYSRFGSKYASTSIWNAYGQYGSPYATNSAFNPYTSTPPALYDADDEKIGYVTLNKYLSGKTFSPWAIESYLRDKCNNEAGYRQRD